MSAFVRLFSQKSGVQGPLVFDPVPRRGWGAVSRLGAATLAPAAGVREGGSRGPPLDRAGALAVLRDSCGIVFQKKATENLRLGVGTRLRSVLVFVCRIPDHPLAGLKNLLMRDLVAQIPHEQVF